MSNLLFNVQGRANRAKFWLVALGIVVVEVILFAVILGGAALSGDPEQIAAAMGPVASVVILVFVVIATWISIAVAVKRYHDRNKRRLVGADRLRAGHRRAVVPDRVRLPARHARPEHLRSRPVGRRVIAEEARPATCAP